VTGGCYFGYIWGAGKPMHRFRHATALSLLAIFLAWQVGVIVHLSSSSHEIGRDGRAVAASSDTRGDRDGDRKGNGGSHDRTCPFLESITFPGSLASSFALPEISNVCVESLPRCPATSTALTGRKIYDISPSHSPPIAS